MFYQNRLSLRNETRSVEFHKGRVQHNLIKSLLYSIFTCFYLTWFLCPSMFLRLNASWKEEICPKI